MAWRTNEIDSRGVYITNIAESLDKSRLFIEVLSNPMIAKYEVSNINNYGLDRKRVYELYRYGKTATASGESSGTFRLGTTPIYEEGAMWIED